MTRKDETAQEEVKEQSQPETAPGQITSQEVLDGAKGHIRRALEMLTLLN